MTSVPSDSPDDFQTLTDLRKKPEFYGIDPAWAALEPVPLISTPTYGDLIAPAVVKQLKIQSQKDTKQLAEAKVFAVISGRSVVHVSTVGDSAIFTPTGRVLDSQAHWTQGSVIADVPLATGITPAIAAGAWPAIALSALGALGVLLSLMTRTRAIAVRPETVRREPVGRAASAPSARGSRR